MMPVSQQLELLWMENLGLSTLACCLCFTRAVDVYKCMLNTASSYRYLPMRSTTRDPAWDSWWEGREEEHAVGLKARQRWNMPGSVPIRCQG